jgi:hypothetical protein
LTSSLRRAVASYQNVLSLKAYLLQKFRLAAEQVAVEVCGMFKNKVRFPLLPALRCVRQPLLCSVEYISNAHFVLYSRVRDQQMTVLDEALTVLDMTTKAWDAQSELVLYFRLKPAATGRGVKP